MAKPILHITRGLPASGKTTAAMAWVAGNPAMRVNVCRDDLREMAFGGYVSENERSLVRMRDAFAAQALKQGKNVMISDTNLPNRVVRDLRDLAERHRAHFNIVDMTNVTLQTCLARDAERGDKVGAKAITDMYNRFIKGKPWPLPVVEPEEDSRDFRPYVRPLNKPKIILVDLDGTVALNGGRSPYDMTRVGDDRPNTPVIEAVQAMYRCGYRIVFFSARSEDAREATEKWLAQHARVGHSGLFMRAEGDKRKDYIVKYEMFNAHIRDHYDVVFVFDDRDQVVNMWRELGLRCFQVAEGNF